MIIEGSDRKKFEKLGASNLLDLALIAPSSYEDRRLYPYLRLSKENAFEAVVKNFYETPKYIKLTLFLKNVNKTLEALIFHPKSYHKRAFTIGKECYITGRVENSYGKVQIFQPKIVDSVGEIIPKYKTPLRSKTVSELMKKYLKRESLSAYGLREEEITVLLNLHFPPPSFSLEDESVRRVLKFVEIYNYMLKLSKKKRVYKASRRIFADPSGFIKSLPFRLTNDQLKAIEDIREDLSKEIAARRVIMGDVGCGKTIVMLAAAFMAYPSKSVLMAPTTVLAKQIYNEALKYLPNFKIALVTNKTKEESLEKYDFLIGTHALLYRNLPKCDLVMVDEQHRFGTVQREMIKKLISKDESTRPHYLQFSATPIPRTMSLIESNLVSFSFIKELPFKKEVTTKIVTKENFKELISHIKREALNDRQTIVVYPLVEESEVIDYLSIEEAKEYWLKNFEGVYVTYGKDREKEDVLEEFAENGKILIATTLIEVGISLPKLSTIVIVAPERLGLATLHQLRGRVSRNGLRGYCFLFTKTPGNERLREFCKTSDGFEIAKLDLKFRQSGDILTGEHQSGKSFKFFDPAEDEKIAKEAKMRVDAFLRKRDKIL